MNKLTPYTHWLLRLPFAVVFLYHGLPKLARAQLTSVSLNLPLLVVYLVAMAEIFGALLVLLGGLKRDWATRAGGLLIVPVISGAIRMHWGQWSFLPTPTHPMGGMEFQVVLLALALYFAIKGND